MDLPARPDHPVLGGDKRRPRAAPVPAVDAPASAYRSRPCRARTPAAAEPAPPGTAHPGDLHRPPRRPANTSTYAPGSRRCLTARGSEQGQQTGIGVGTGLAAALVLLRLRGVLRLSRCGKQGEERADPVSFLGGVP